MSSVVDTAQIATCNLLEEQLLNWFKEMGVEPLSTFGGIDGGAYFKVVYEITHEDLNLLLLTNEKKYRMNKMGDEGYLYIFYGK